MDHDGVCPQRPFKAFPRVRLTAIPEDEASSIIMESIPTDRLADQRGEETTACPPPVLDGALAMRAF